MNTKQISGIAIGLITVIVGFAFLNVAELPPWSLVSLIPWFTLSLILVRG